MIKQFRKAVDHPWTAFRRLKANITRPFVEKPNHTITHFKEDWDTLILLDACRFDMFAKHNTITGDLKKEYSTASHTTDFVRENLKNPQHDTIYVTASPQLVGYEEMVYKMIHVWEDNWSKEYRTVLPRDITEVAIQALKDYPNKRLVVHYMQPHYPFIGEMRDTIGDIATFSGGTEDREMDSIWDLLTAGRIAEQVVWEAYEENLQLTLPHVDKLISQVTGKTVVSSDHGNLFNKKIGGLPIRINGHPLNYPDKELLAVPWLTVPFEERRLITTEERAEDGETKVEAINQRLEALGYVTS